MLRSRLLNRIRTEGWTTLAVTSPGAAEGKTVVSINLALSLAREGSSDVFLLDLDMRNPSVARYLGVTPPREIIDYFSGESPPAEIFFSVGPERLAIASGLDSTDHASEYLASAKFEELIDYIRQVGHNPIILIDLPPLLASDEGILLAPRVDAVSLVIAEGRTSRDGLVRAKQLLEGHTLAGVILNRSHDALAGAEYYSYGVRPKGSQ
jgi:Mrp family chromosome partitioning ATPase